MPTAADRVRINASLKSMDDFSAQLRENLFNDNAEPDEFIDEMLKAIMNEAFFVRVILGFVEPPADDE